MKFKTEIFEMARIACASIPDTIVDEMDASDDFFVEIRDYIQGELNEKMSKDTITKEDVNGHEITIPAEGEKKKYYVGISIVNCFEVTAKDKEEAEDIVRNYSNEETLNDSAFLINYVDEIKDSVNYYNEVEHG
tara:strand:- start:2651 stop:3052 length:402 start_codon:yes stop_codon:yes gene_type:complete